jgi:hypothetical protein
MGGGERSVPRIVLAVKAVRVRPSNAAHYRLLGSCGRGAGLLGNSGIAALYERASTASVGAAEPWMLMSAVAAVSAGAIDRFLPSQRRWSSLL